MKAKLMISALAVFVFFFGFANAVKADETQMLSRMQTLEKQIQEMQKIMNWQTEKLQGIEKTSTPSNIIPAGDFDENLKASIGDAASWLKGLKFSGDLRLRYEAFDYSSGHPSETDPQNRFRFRLRLGAEKKLSDEFKAGFGLASGGTTDPTSTNATFDGNFTYKTIVIDQAYATYTPNWAKVGPIESLQMTGGKFKNPFIEGSSKIVWDHDVMPEGIYERIGFNLFDGETADVKGYLTAGQFVLDEDSTLGSGTTGGDAELYAFQAGIMPEIKFDGMKNPVKTKHALSYYSYSDYAVQSNFGSLARGNPNVDGNTSALDAGDFEIIEIYNELGFQLEGLPKSKFFFDWATNLDEHAPSASLGGENDAWAMGLKLGEAKKKGGWELSYEYRWIEPNAVVGAFNDSDFGTGHADKRGSVFGAAYNFTDFLQMNLTAFFVNNISANTILRDEEQRRFQADLIWKF